jgi:chromosomal replication initiator protein
MPEIPDLIAAAAALEGGTASDVLGPDRHRRAVRPRHAAMWLAFKVTPDSLPAIGRAFGRHHTTVLYGIRAHERRLAADAATRARGEALLAQFVDGAAAASNQAHMEMEIRS